MGRFGRHLWTLVRPSPVAKSSRRMSVSSKGITSSHVTSTSSDRSPSTTPSSPSPLPNGYTSTTAILGSKGSFAEFTDNCDPAGDFFLNHRHGRVTHGEENFRKLKFKPNQFTEFLTSIGFSEPENLTSRGGGQTSTKGFKTREVLLYSKPLNI